jgi:predicted DNA-binding transcriptional regulator AlpA
VCGDVVRPRLVRNCPGPRGQVTVAPPHLLGMDATTQITATILTQRELAELLRLPERTLEDWRLTHTGPPYLKLGRHVRYDVQDVLAWVQEHRHG